jgi:biopolymer transport protein TolQ
MNIFFEMVGKVGPVGKSILALLLFASIMSWTLIFMKWKSLRASMNENGHFLNLFWHAQSIEDVFSKADQYPASSVASVFRSGFKELKKHPSLDSVGLDNVSRSLNRASIAEVGHLEKHVSWLATIGSAAPFIGLFGTVWGIMESFHAIGLTGSANLAVVAPGIAEALINTAIGIAAAVPALVAYNQFANQIKKQVIDIDTFSQDFLNILSRGSARAKGGA